MTATSTIPEFRSIPIGQLHESPLNPRRHFHEAKLQELATAIASHGILTPLLARPMATSAKGLAFELAAGHRRYRASKLANVTELPVLVREMSDTEFIEVLTIENLQREDVHPIEEAQGYADLIQHAGYDVAHIAERVGRSVRYVYDRLRMLQLTPALQEIFFRGEITAGHAILLARLSPADQARALDATGALFTFEHGHPVEGELELEDPRKPMSVRELQAWIDQHVRFDVGADDVPQLFPETAAVVTPAIEQAEKVISITHNYHVDPGAKPEDGERTYTSSSWKRADGQQGSKACDRAVTGVIVVGPGRGEAFKVCTDKKKCTVHWGGEIREAAKRAKLAATGGEDEVHTARAKVAARQAEQRARQESERAAFIAAKARILEAVAAQVKKLPATATGALAQILTREIDRTSRNSSKAISLGTTAADLLRYLAFSIIESEINYYNAHETFPKMAKGLGIDVAKLLKGTTAAPAKPATKKKKATS